MSDLTKITLSDKELSLVTTTYHILTKQAIIQKVFELFAGNVAVINAAFKSARVKLPVELVNAEPRIFKGENYLQLPYVIMDYPRLFHKEDIFALRTMFWWGNFFSITLHVSGKYKTAFISSLSRKVELIGKEFYIGVNEDQWQHHFEKENFMPYHQYQEKQKCLFPGHNNFLKLALKFDLEKWNDMPDIMKDGYQKIAGILA